MIIVDANQPENILDSFIVCNSHVLCIASVPGKKPVRAILKVNTDLFLSVLEMLEPCASVEYGWNCGAVSSGR